MSNKIELSPFSKEVLPIVDGNLIKQLKAVGLHDQFLAKQPSDDPDINLTGFYTCPSNPQENLIETDVFEVTSNNLSNRTEHLELVQDQQIDEIVGQVISWKNRDHLVESSILQMPLRKYRKKFNHLVNESDLLYRSFYDDCGKVKTKQFFVHKTLWREFIFHLYNSKTAGHFGIVKTVEEF